MHVVRRDWAPPVSKQGVYVACVGVLLAVVVEALAAFVQAGAIRTDSRGTVAISQATFRRIASCTTTIHAKGARGRTGVTFVTGNRTCAALVGVTVVSIWSLWESIGWSSGHHGQVAVDLIIFVKWMMTGPQGTGCSDGTILVTGTLHTGHRCTGS